MFIIWINIVSVDSVSRVLLAVLHFNHNADRPLKVKDGDPVLTVSFPKAKKGPSVKVLKAAPTYG